MSDPLDREQDTTWATVHEQQTPAGRTHRGGTDA
ncbi:hypothetical protein E9228_000630 [Curtobacterium flaccumfaciens]|uniref:Uncharacterized protein n=1 Tax=Curtobacterium salicis TaxID=1779862 RepID=A0ABX0T6D4_9MICO|nr:hypothetical protein [Curtobacterium sp. WW7]